jgi:hypothetical protein
LSHPDINSYAENFANTLRAKGWLVANVNAQDAKKQRENLQASTDRTALMGIATMLLNRRANCCPAQSGTYRNLRTLVRHRKKLVKSSLNAVQIITCPFGPILKISGVKQARLIWPSQKTSRWVNGDISYRSSME